MNEQTKAAMQMALECCEEHAPHEAASILREALEQPQGEWVDLTEDDYAYLLKNNRMFDFQVRAVIAKFKEKNTPPVVQQGEPVGYVTEPQNLLPNGLTLLQTNPDCAVQLNSGRDFGWLYMKGADGQWVTHRKLSPEEINEAQDQAADMVVVKRESVFEKMFAAPIANPPVVPQEPLGCHHRIADARNPVVKSGYICVDCGALFSAADHKAPQGEPVAWMDAEGDVYKMPVVDKWLPPHQMLYTTPPSVEAAMSKLQHKYDELLEHYTWQGNQYMEAMRNKAAEVEAMRIETLENAAKLIEERAKQRHGYDKHEDAAAIRSMK